MFQQRAAIGTRPTTGGDDAPFVDEQLEKSDPKAEERRRHAVLMDALDDEADRQSEERVQAAIDEDYYDHLQWRQDDAAVLIERGQLPLVYNEARQTIDWIAGTEKRMRKDYKILGREPKDEQGAEIATQVVKYTDDVNRSQWHKSKAFKQAALSGISWLEEGVNTDPGEEIIYAGSEDWRNVYRDSRNRNFDLNVDSRYLFRRKKLDLDYAIALLPKAADILRSQSSTDDALDEDSVWYLGERLTNASDLYNDGLPATWNDRRAYIGSGYVDGGRRAAVELLECWYRVPEAVQVFNDGPLAGKVYIDADKGHQQLKSDGCGLYDCVKMRMRVMVATREDPLWDGVSPFAHGRFLMVPVWGYRRYRDGQTYGVMRGMRDLQDDTNKRGSKALWLLSSNRIVTEKGAVDDIELVREEAARPDGIIEVNTGRTLKFEKPTGEATGNLEMMDRNIQFMRDIGGVTNANLGRGANGQSGISVERQQDQGSLTTSELFDNLLLARKMAGELRLSHIKQFKTAPATIRVTGEAMPTEYLKVNEWNPDTGQFMNDLTQINCDFIVAEQDYRESYIRAATAEMFELLGQIAQYAPQMVMAVLDLAVEGSEVRIRKINGQRDPTKPPTPQEVQQQQEDQAKQQKLAQAQVDTVMAQLAKVQKEVEKLDADAIAQRVDAMFAALQAAQIVAVTPTVAPVGDEIMAGAGFQDQHGQDPGLQPPPQPAQPAIPQGQPQHVLPRSVPIQNVAPEAGAQPAAPSDAAPQQLAGVHQGIETPRPTDNGPAM
jgi:hypothetical protein